MGLTFYAPTKSKTGGLVDVRVTAKVGTYEKAGERAVYLNLVKQTGWDEATSKGSFKDGPKINVKLTLDEVAGMIQAVRDKQRYAFYHTFDGKTTTGSLSFYSFDEEKDKTGKVIKKARSGFGLTVKKDEVEIKVGFGLASAENLHQYLIFCLNHCYNAIYSEDKKNAEDYAKKTEGQGQTVPKGKPKAPEVEAPVEPDEPPDVEY
jgi:hypothetical protein